MSVSIIWKLSEKEKENQITFENIREQIAENKQSVQILIYANACDNGKNMAADLNRPEQKHNCVHMRVPTLKFMQMHRKK